MTYPSPKTIPVRDFEARVERLREVMREHDLDGVIAGDASGEAPGSTWAGNPTYARYLAGFAVPHSPGLRNAIVVVPLEGAPALVVPTGIRGSIAHVARQTTWIENVISSSDLDPEWQAGNRWGLFSDEGHDVVQALRATGLEKGRIGVSGTWAGREATYAALPDATFVPTVVVDEGGVGRDLLAPIVVGSTEAEMERIEMSHRAADAAVQRYIEVACDGATYRDALTEAQVAGLRAGASEVVLYGTLSVDPWAFWDIAGADPNAHFQPGRLYFTEVACVYVDGYSVQKARSFVPGEPTERQRRIMTTIRESNEAIYAVLRAGRTAGELWEAGIEPIARAGLEPWAQLGHNQGVMPWPRFTSIMPGNPEPLHDGQVMVVHIGVTDVESGDTGMAGDSVVVTVDGHRPLSANPSPFDLLTTYDL